MSRMARTVMVRACSSNLVRALGRQEWLIRCEPKPVSHSLFTYMLPPENVTTPHSEKKEARGKGGQRGRAKHTATLGNSAIWFFPATFTVNAFVFITSSAAGTSIGIWLLLARSKIASSPSFPTRDIARLSISLPSTRRTRTGNTMSAITAACSTISTVPRGIFRVATTPLPFPGISRISYGRSVGSAGEGALVRASDARRTSRDRIAVVSLRSLATEKGMAITDTPRDWNLELV